MRWDGATEVFDSARTRGRWSMLCRKRVETWRAIHYSRVSHWKQFGNQSALFSRNRWPSQHNRHRERGRHAYITSTVSGNGDHGADPNKLVVITDTLADTTLPARERFKTLLTAGYGEVLRGVSWTPVRVILGTQRISTTRTTEISEAK